MLNISHLTTGYGKRVVLHDVSLSIAQGEILIITGGNGSGKSTLLRSIYGLIPPFNRDAKISFKGENIVGRPTSSLIFEGLAYLPQKKNVFDNLTVEENLMVSANSYPRNIIHERIEEVYTYFPTLKKFRKRKPFNLSGGERQFLAFSNIMVHHFSLALLDEPFAGVDEQNSQIIKNQILEMNAKGKSFVIVEHKAILNDLTHRKVSLDLGIINI